MTTPTGYVLEPVRIGQSNSPFTASPDVYVDNQTAFDAAYPTDESVPRTEYHLFVIGDGKLPDATYGWTKNEGAVQDGNQVPFERFGYDGRDSRFRTLPGGSREEAGVLSQDANTSRLSVTAPILTSLGDFPIRVSVGTGSGTTFTIVLVNLDSQLNSPDPPQGSVQISLESGSLGWNPVDLVTYIGQTVWFQRQPFFPLDESTGNIGVIEDPVLLNPLPATGQIPLVRIGFDLYLTAVEVANEGAFGSPVSGTFEWALDTGRLNFNTNDVAANPAQSIFYDGVAFSVTLSIESRAQGTVSTPSNVSPLPSEDSDLFFRAGTYQFPTTEYVDAFPSSTARGTVSVRRSDGALQFSSIDVTDYGSETLTAYISDLTLERGLKFRVFRSVVDPGASDSSVKDASAFYETESAVYADPIIASPQVLLPAVPVSSLTYTVKIQQGTGSYTDDDFPRLDVAAPPTGYGYVLDAEERQIVFAQRKEDAIVRPETDYGAVQLDPLLLTDPDVALETSPNSGTFVPLVQDQDFVVEPEAGLVTFTQTDGTLISEGTGAWVSGTTFYDYYADFVADNVLPGDTVIFSDLVGTVVSRDFSKKLTLDVSSPNLISGLSYEIRRGYEVLANRYFQEVPAVDPNTKVERLTDLGTATNSPRLSINTAFIGRTRFRFGTTTFTTVTTVPDDGSFGSPSSGTVEISEATGNLNFATADLGQTVFEAREQILGSDYELQPVLGFISFTERFFEGEEAVITYVNVDADGNRTLVEERGRFLVRKEETADHLSPTSTLSFNPLGREVAATPAPRAFRGGRPQVVGEQVEFNLVASTVTFIEAATVTDALPSGPIVEPSERVLVDYNVLSAVGGERDITVTQPPMAGADFSIEAEETSFRLIGDRSTEFPEDYLLKVDNATVYLLAAPIVAFDADLGVDVTTVNLASDQEFQDDLSNPPLAVSSGETPGSLPYFTLVVEPFEVIPRGGTTLRFLGDVVGSYPSNTVLQFSQSGHLYYAEVEGSVFDGDTGYTEVTLSAGIPRQYETSVTTLRRSALPIFPSSVADVHTSRVPRLELPVRVFRCIDGQFGTSLSEPSDYTIDDSGRVVLSQALQPEETVGICYVGVTTVEALRAVQASYTFTIAPDTGNGILNQVMRADYTTCIPDSYYFRVETFTNFRGELAQSFEDSAKANSPSGGPILENASSPRLYEEGTEGAYFTERHLANEDIVSRATLLSYNDAVNALEDVLQSLDGRVVGGHNGRFIFDGVIDNPPRTTFDQVTNQIDDVFKVSPAPYTINFSGGSFSISSSGTFQEVYKPAPTSRFFPTERTISSGIDDYSSPETGDIIGAFGYEDVKNVTTLRTRRAYALVTGDAPVGTTVLTVDNAEGAAEGIRPPFKNGMVVKIVDRTGTLLEDNLTVSGFSSTSLTVSATSVVVPTGATVMLDEVNDTASYSGFQIGLDVLLDSERGLLLYVTYPGVSNNPPPPGSAFLSTFGAPNPTPAPERFPALDGSTLDDDGGVRLPLLTPDPDSEAGEDIGYIRKERQLIEPGGLIPSNTTEAFVSTADINTPGNILKLTSGSFPATVQEGDILRVTSGVNAPSIYYRITSIPFTDQVVIDGTLTTDTSVEIYVGHSANLESGTATNTAGGPGLTNVNDPTATFVSNNVLPGHTAVFNVGGVYERRQVEQVLNETNLVVSGASLGVYAYRITDTILSFGTSVSGGSYHDDLLSALSGEYQTLVTNLSPVRSQVEGAQEFYSQVLTQTVTGTAGSVSLGGYVLTDLTKDFFAEDLDTGDFLHIDSGVATGFYQVATILSSTEVQMMEMFPATDSGISYSFERSSVVTLESLQLIKNVENLAEAAAVLVTSYNAIVGATVAVFGDASALGREDFEFSSRVTAIDARLASLPGIISNVESVLTTGDRFYDRRFVWIDTRINQETGVIVRKERAAQERIENEEQAVTELIKLLTT